jgi:hypothetical protein
MKQVLFILLVFISFQGFSQTTMETIKIDSLEVMKGNLGEMDWYEAIKACEKLGDGWRLPIFEELELIYHKLYIISDTGIAFEYGNYWSSTEDNDVQAWTFDFTLISGDSGYEVFNKNRKAYFRPVRNIKL